MQYMQLRAAESDVLIIIIIIIMRSDEARRLTPDTPTQLGANDTD